MICGLKWCIHWTAKFTLFRVFVQSCEFRIGFMARLSVEKNPGLFIMAAHHILNRIPFARFVIIGDGVLLPKLKELTAILNIGWAVDFKGTLTKANLTRKKYLCSEKIS